MERRCYVIFNKLFSKEMVDDTERVECIDMDSPNLHLFATLIDLYGLVHS